jgi:hypothetical protein
MIMAFSPVEITQYGRLKTRGEINSKHISSQDGDSPANLYKTEFPSLV